MGNIGGAEVLVILLVALIVLGPTKLPVAIRQVGRFVGEMRRIGAGFQQELREATEPLREPLRKTQAALKAADKELREATKPLKETADGLKASDPRKAMTPPPKGAKKPSEGPPPKGAKKPSEGPAPKGAKKPSEGPAPTGRRSRARARLPRPRGLRGRSVGRGADERSCEAARLGHDRRGR